MQLSRVSCMVVLYVPPITLFPSTVAKIVDFPGSVDRGLAGVELAWGSWVGGCLV
jgi:hypothetical protein